MNQSARNTHRTTFTPLTIALALSLAAPTLAEPVTSVDDFFQPDGMTATAENYPTLETSRQLLIAQSRAAVNEIAHNRQLTPTDDQPVVRMNRDTYYGFAVVDVSAGASITIPPVPEGKYVSVQPVTMDHRIQPMSYGSGTFELATHYGSHMYLVIRLDSTLTEAEANAIQDGMAIDAASAQPFSAEPVNKESFDAVELSLRQKLPDLVKTHGPNMVNGMFTAPTDDSRGMFDFDKYTVGAAVGWAVRNWPTIFTRVPPISLRRAATQRRSKTLITAPSGRSRSTMKMALCSTTLRI